MQEDDFVKSIRLPETSKNTSCYAFSVHKSGSTFLFNMLHDLAPHVGYGYFSLNDVMFSRGLNVKLLSTAAVSDVFNTSGYIFGGFRGMPRYQLPHMVERKGILLIRHPLDALVSGYYSSKSSHVLPGAGLLRRSFQAIRARASSQTIEEYVVDRGPALYKQIMDYLPLLAGDQVKVYRYEDIVYRKHQFLVDIASHYGWDIDSEILREISAKYDEFPDVEDQASHIRQVHPGNYRKVLPDSLIVDLEKEFDLILKAFGYLPCAKVAYATMIKSDYSPQGNVEPILPG